MKTSELGGPLLKSVSRSFYLTIRILPARLSAPIGLAYLLARASDTIADSANAAVAVRLDHLRAFVEIVRSGTRAGIEQLQRDIQPPDFAERKLILRLDECFDWLALLDDFDRDAIAQVLAQIVHGQMLDVERFQNSARVTALQTAADLEEYTYLVAGCVGEFWTRLCLHHLPRCARLPEQELCAVGRNYGKGLQLVNILRDVAADHRAGRCYLPKDELLAAGSSPELPGAEVFARWRRRAAELLEDGRAYIAALRPMRLRIACFLPWYLGMETLRLMQHRSPLQSAEKIKVPRSTVRTALLRAPLIGISNKALLALLSHGLARK